MNYEVKVIRAKIIPTSLTVEIKEMIWRMDIIPC